MNTPAFESAAETSPLVFGDNGEFTYDSSVESVSVDGAIIDEITLFFHDNRNASMKDLDPVSKDDNLRALTIKTGEINAVIEGDEETNSHPSIQVTAIDPHVVLKTLRMPSKAIIDLSTPIPVEADD